MRSNPAVPGTSPAKRATGDLDTEFANVHHCGAYCAMPTKEKTIRQSVTLPMEVASQVRAMAKRRRLSTSRMVVELLEEGLESRKAKEKAFFDLAERFRQTENADEAARLGDELGKIAFGK